MRITIVDQGITLYSSSSKVLNNFCVEEDYSQEYVQTQEDIDAYNEATFMYDCRNAQLEQELSF